MGSGSSAQHMLTYIVAISLGIAFITSLLIPQLISLATTDVTDLDPAAASMLLFFQVVIAISLIVIALKGAGLFGGR